MFLQRFRNPVFKYLLGVLKVAKDDTQISSTLTGLRDLCGIYGPGMFGPHKEYLVERRDTEEKTNIKGQLSALVDQIEGRRYLKYIRKFGTVMIQLNIITGAYLEFKNDRSIFRMDSFNESATG